MEKYLKEKVLPDLDNGRPNHDKPHTIGVVAWLKKILAHSPEISVDEVVLLIAAYTHDWGYVGMFDGLKSLSYKDTRNAKPKHMKLGAAKVSKLLEDKVFSSLTDAQKKRCVHLVAVHDKLDQLKDIDELILMEADTLGALDVNSVKPTFDFESNQKYIQGVKIRRVPIFITDFGKKQVKKLIQARTEYYNENPDSGR